MQFYGPRALLLYFCFSAVFPETNSNHFGRWQRGCRYFACSCLFLMAAIFSPGAAKGQVPGRGTLTTTPSSISFGSVADGTTNSQTVQLKNTGAANLTISSATVNGTGFKFSGISTPLTLAPAKTLNFTIAFGPTVTGSVTGTMTIKSNATDSTHTIALSGSGTTATRTISLLTSSLNFGSEMVGGTSPLQVAVKNTGNSSLTISQINVAGTGFSVTSGISGSTIKAGQTAELNVVFAPKVTGSVSGVVTLVSNATNSPNSVAVTGTGVSSTTHSASLSWTASSSSGVAGYYVYRSTVSGGSYARITAASLNALKFTDDAVSAGHTYYYVVTTVSSNGSESVDSEQASAVIP